jgi:hypothetical protein
MKFLLALHPSSLQTGASCLAVVGSTSASIIGASTASRRFTLASDHNMKFVAIVELNQIAHSALTTATPERPRGSKP